MGINILAWYELEMMESFAQNRLKYFSNNWDQLQVENENGVYETANEWQIKRVT